MAYQTIDYTVEDNLAEVVLDQPEKHNPLSKEASEELLEALERAEDDDRVHTVYLTGAGDSFSAGGDIEEFTGFETKRATEIFSEGEATADLFKRLSTYEKPVVGGINGSALGGGVGLVAACHITYASRDALFGTTEITLGLFPLVILPALRSTVGDQTALELALTGKRISADEAADIGLVTSVVSEDSLQDQARGAAREIANWSPLATSLGLQVFQETADMPPERAIDVLNAYRVLFYKSHDLNEGARAFLENRDPQWKGY